MADMNNVKYLVRGGKMVRNDKTAANERRWLCKSYGVNAMHGIYAGATAP